MQPSQDSYTTNIAEVNGYTNAIYSGWIEANVTLSALNLCGMLYHNSPTPCTITALVCEYEVHQS